MRKQLAYNIVIAWMNERAAESNATITNRSGSKSIQWEALDGVPFLLWSVSEQDALVIEYTKIGSGLKLNKIGQPYCIKSGIFYTWHPMLGWFEMDNQLQFDAVSIAPRLYLNWDEAGILWGVK